MDNDDIELKVILSREMRERCSRVSTSVEHADGEELWLAAQREKGGLIPVMMQLEAALKKRSKGALSERRRLIMAQSGSRNDVQRSVQTMREALAQLRRDYGYLAHAETASEDLERAIEAFNCQLFIDLEEHEERLARLRAMHGGG